MDEAHNKHWILMGLITIGFILCAVFVPNLSEYAFIGAVMMAGFMIYLVYSDKIADFISVDYDAELSNKLLFNAYKNNKGEIKGIYLTGENIFPYKKLGDCVGYFSYSFDIVPELFKEVSDSSGMKKLVEDYSGNKKTHELYCFYYPLFNGNFLINFFQKTVPKIPILSNILRLIPFFNQFFFPMYKGVITTMDRCTFKRDIVEIDGKSLIPLSVRLGFNTYDVVEYTGKYDETRKMERYLFVKEINSDWMLQMMILMKNSVETSAKMNPKVNLDKEQSITKSR